jgi:hypothetical protein
VVTPKSAVFDRGFLDGCEAVATKRVTAEVHFHHAEWATVRSIRFQGQSRITPAMRSLREAIGVDATGLAQLVVSGHPRLERLNLNEAALFRAGPGVEPNDTVRAFATCDKDKLPKLMHLELDVPFLEKLRTDWIWKATWSKQLRSIGIPSNALGPWIEELRRREHLEEICFLGDAYRVIVRKQSERLGLRVNVRVEEIPLPSNVERALHDTLRDLAMLDPSCNVQLDIPPDLPYAQQQRLEQAISRFKRA